MKNSRKWLLTATLLLGGAFMREAAAQDPYAVACIDCTTMTQLHSKASAVANTAPYLPAGTIVMVISTRQYLTAYYRVGQYMICQIPYYPYAYHCSAGGTVVRYTTPITLSEAEAKALDEALIAKSIGQVRINPTYGTSAHSALDLDVNSGIRQVAPVVRTMFGGYRIVINGKQIPVEPGKTELEVVFNDGSKMKFLLTVVESTIAWVLVSRTDADGNVLPEPHSGGEGGGAANPPQPPPYNQPGYPTYCPVQVISHVCIEEVGSNGACPATDSGQVTVYLRPCGS